MSTSLKRTSTSQYEIMISHFEKCPAMLSGKVDPLFTKDMKDKKWEALATALNAEGNGPSKSVTGWRKTLKDWKCYVRKKAGQIALHSKQTGGGPPLKEKLTLVEEKLLGAIGEVSAHGQKCIEESPIFGDADLDVSMDMNVMEDDIQDYCGNKKAVKRKIKNSLAVEVSKKLISTQTETNFQKKRLADVAEKKATLIEKKIEVCERKVLALERQATAAENLTTLKMKKLHQQWYKNMNLLRINKLKYL